MGKAVKKIAKPIAKIIPKEIRPALPFILPFIPGIGPALGSMQSALTSKLAFAGKLAPYLSQGIMASGTQALTDPNAKTSDLFRTAALSVAPAAISEGLGALPTDKGIGKFLSETAKGADATRLEKIQAALGKVDPGKTGYASQLDVATGSVPVSEVAKIVGPEGFTKAATLAAAQTGLSQAPIVARMNEQALRDYEAQLREQGIMDSSERRNKIFGYFTNAGYDVDETNAFLDKYGYATGGVVAARRGLVNRPGGYAGDRKMAAQDYAEELAQDKYGKDFYDLPQIIQMDLYQEALDFVDDGMADGGKVKKKNEGILAKMTLEEFIRDYYIPRETKAEDGGMIPKRGLVDEPGGYAGDVGKTLVFRDLMRTGKYTPEEAMRLAKELDEDDDVDLKGLSSGLEGMMSGYQLATGQPLMGSKPPPTRFGLADGGIMNLGGREMDMRGGGFIPIGAKEKADDVPARLSKNEFVMTADAVRAAGGGSVNKGAKRMYDLMNRLEAKV